MKSIRLKTQYFLLNYWNFIQLHFCIKQILDNQLTLLTRQTYMYNKLTEAHVSFKFNILALTTKHLTELQLILYFSS